MVSKIVFLGEFQSFNTISLGIVRYAGADLEEIDF